MDEIKSLSDELRSRVCIAQDGITDESKLTEQEMDFATQTAIHSMDDQIFASIIVRYPNADASCYITSMRDETTLVHIAVAGEQGFRVFSRGENPAPWISDMFASHGVDVKMTPSDAFKGGLH